MQYWKNSKNFNILFVCLLLTACVDKLPGTIRKAEELTRTQVYGYRADEWKQIEDYYLAGQANCCGPDKRNDDVKALNNYCEAAMLGHKASQIEIGRLYMHEAGAGPSTTVPFDKATAHAYYNLAAQGGYTYAAVMADGLAPKLTADELARSKQLVAEFPAIPCKITR